MEPTAQTTKEQSAPLAYPASGVIVTPLVSALKFFLDEKEAGHLVFRISETPIPFAPDFLLHDIKTMDRHSEERLLVKHPKYIYNMRRGTCYLAHKGVLAGLKEGKVPTELPIQYARRGMFKFFDLLPEYLAENFKLPNVDIRADHIFFPVAESFRAGNSVEVICMRKANGESAQVSYSDLVNAWVVSSKNVSICIRNREDIKGYEQ